MSQRPFGAPFHIGVEEPAAAGLFPCQEDRQGIDPFAEILVGFLANHRTIGYEVEEIVAHLEHKSQTFAEGLEHPRYPFITAAFHRADTATGAEQGDGLAVDVLQILVNSDVLFIAAHGLADFAGTHFLYSLGDDHTCPVQSLAHQVEGDAAHQEIAGIDGCVLPVLALHRRLAAPDRCIVDNIVMNQ